MAELVNHPSHYNQPNRKECIEEMRDKFGDEIVAVFCLTNAYKYLYRAGEKEGNSKEQDIAKAKWYFTYFECNILCNSIGTDISDYVWDLYRKLISAYVKGVKELYNE